MEKERSYCVHIKIGLLVIVVVPEQDRMEDPRSRISLALVALRHRVRPVNELVSEVLYFPITELFELELVKYL